MNHLRKPLLAIGAGAAMLCVGAMQSAVAEVGFGKPGEAINLVVGYQPYYTESWSGVVINGQQSWKKYLPAGSDGFCSFAAVTIVPHSKEFSSAGTSYGAFKHKYVIGKRHDDL